jgi:hypothetical protein
MSTFADTANVDYRLSFVDQGKQTSVLRLQKINGSCCFHFPFAANKQKLQFSVTSVFLIYIFFEAATEIYFYLYIYIYIYIYLSISIYLYTYIYIYICICCCCKRKMEAQAIFPNPFTVFSSCKQKFFVSQFVN